MLLPWLEQNLPHWSAILVSLQMHEIEPPAVLGRLPHSSHVAYGLCVQCVCVGHVDVLCEKGWTDWDAIWWQTDVLNELQSPDALTGSGDIYWPVVNTIGSESLNRIWLRPLNIGPSYARKKAASQKHWHSILDMATLKKTMPWERQGGVCVMMWSSAKLFRTLVHFASIAVPSTSLVSIKLSVHLKNGLCCCHCRWS